MYGISPRQRTASAIAASAVVGLGGLALVLGLSTPMQVVSQVRDTLVAITPARKEPPRPVPSPSPSPIPMPTPAEKAETSRKKNPASPENIRNQATQVFAPVLPPLRPAPVIAAPRPAQGNASNTGASDRPGPGQGASGVGDGTGGGGNGEGNGDGDGDSYTRPVQTRGKLRWSDLPADLRRTHRGGELELVYRVNVDGRVSDCRVTRSSGLPSLDAQTCRLITERFRFRPSLDPRGRPVASYIEETHGWDPAPDDVTDP